MEILSPDERLRQRAAETLARRRAAPPAVPDREDPAAPRENAPSRPSTGDAQTRGLDEFLRATPPRRYDARADLADVRPDATATPPTAAPSAREADRVERVAQRNVSGPNLAEQERIAAEEAAITAAQEEAGFVGRRVNDAKNVVRGVQRMASAVGEFDAAVKEQGVTSLLPDLPGPGLRDIAMAT